MQKAIPAIYRYVRFAIITVRKPDVKVQKQNLMQHNTGVFVKFAAANSIRRIINGRKTELVPFVRQPAAMKAGRKENVTPVVNNATMKMVLKQKG